MKEIVCKYGENAWQAPAKLVFDEEGCEDTLALHNFTLVEGDSPSYNNYCDADRLLQTLTHIAAVMERNQRNIKYIAGGGKHGNLCGASISTNAFDAICKMILGDPLALFGGLVMTNFPICKQEAELLRRWGMPEGKKRLLDGVLASHFADEAKVELNRKGGKCRLLENSALANLNEESLDRAPRIRYVRGGLLQQPNYTFVLDLNDPDLEVVGSRVSEDLETDMLLAWAVGSTSNSNTITLVKNGKLIANGVGQQDRVGAANLALTRAHRSNHKTFGGVAYSDSFFGFSDAVQILIDAGIKVIFTSKGSLNDEAIREVCRNAGVSLYLLPDSKCRGFFGH